MMQSYGITRSRIAPTCNTRKVLLRELSRRIGIRDPDGSWAQHIRWMARFTAYIRAVSHTPRRAGRGEVTVILPSFRRPWNMELLARSALGAPSVGKIIVSHHNPSVDLRSQFSLHDPAVDLRSTTTARPTAWRWKIAREEGARFVLVMDDDVFLLPQQIERLCRFLLADPSVPHGVFGQLRRADGSFQHAIHAWNREVDVLNRVYAASALHIERFFATLDALGMRDHPDLWSHSLCDDMILSCTGIGRPRIHDVGPFLDCPTQASAAIACWMQEGFHGYRENFFERLLLVTPALAPSSAPERESRAEGTFEGYASDATSRRKSAASQRRESEAARAAPGRAPAKSC
jgi:hypothetical protein